jgi:Uma2 family endonuclease
MARPDRAHRPATYEDLVQAPDHLVAEILDGELYTTPRPAPRHANAGSALLALLRGPFDHGRGGPGGWRILFEPELHLADDVLVPDIAGWRRERLPALPERAYFTEAPDWACEILSPSTAAMDRAKKLTVYARERVSHVWLVDPIARTLEVLRLESGRWTIVSTFTGQDLPRAEPFEAIELELSLVLGEPESQQDSC